jgi:hypothetical protein
MNKNMNEDLSQSQIEQLRQHLIVPLAVGDILHHDLAVEPDMQYGLHMALSEIDPDSALLAIALCARDIATKSLALAPIALALQLEANHIIEAYGATWLHHHTKGPMQENDFEAVLEDVPEDLEAMADLLDALCADLIEETDEESSATVLLGNLLSIQARAHMEIADYILAEIEFEKDVNKNAEQGLPAPEREMIDLDAHVGNNIILFPGAQD